MKCRVNPSKGLRGVIGPEEKFRLPGDKSISHRALVFAAMSNGPCRLENILQAGVTDVMCNSLEQLGIEINRSENLITVTPNPDLSGTTLPKSLYCGHSATTIRLLAGFLCGAQVSCTLDGSQGLRKRPMDRIIQPLRDMGFRINGQNDKYAPLQILPGNIYINDKEVIELDIASAQVKTCLILASLGNTSTISITEPGYSRNHTENFLKLFDYSISVEKINGDKYTTTISRGKYKPPFPSFNIEIPGDFSSASFLLVAASIIKNSELLIKKVGLNETRTGLLDALQLMGADIEILHQEDDNFEPNGDIMVRSANLSGITISGELVTRMIDEFPIFAIAAAFANGKTIVKDAKELRFKESDRINRICTELTKLGIDIKEREDGFEINGSQTVSSTEEINTFQDHRMAMSFITAGLASTSPVIVNGCEMIQQSFPDFIEILNSIGGEIEGRNE